MLTERRSKIRCGKLFRFLRLNQFLNRLLIVFRQKIQHFTAVLLTGVNKTLIKRLQNQLMRLNKPAQSLPKSIETAFQTLDQQNFHKRGQIALTLHGAFFQRFAVIQRTERLITGVMKISTGNTLQGCGKNRAFRRV